jgi:transcriptional regulator with XRE-family HTH domain
MQSLNEALRLFRVFHDMKAKELAEKLNISAAYLSEIEGGRKNPSLGLINKYAEVFHTSPSVISFFSESLNDKDEKKGEPMRAKLLKFMEAIERFSKRTES